MSNPTYRKKLIEVTLPLASINDASAKEKGNPFLKGHPRNLHQWWARRPLATCRAMPYALFASCLKSHLAGRSSSAALLLPFAPLAYIS